MCVEYLGEKRKSEGEVGRFASLALGMDAPGLYVSDFRVQLLLLDHPLEHLLLEPMYPTTDCNGHMLRRRLTDRTLELGGERQTELAACFQDDVGCLSAAVRLGLLPVVDARVH